MPVADTEIYKWEGTILYRRRYGGLAIHIRCCCPICPAGNVLVFYILLTDPTLTLDDLRAIARQGAKKIAKGGGVKPQWKLEFSGIFKDISETLEPGVVWQVAVCDGYNENNSPSEQEAEFFDWTNDYFDDPVNDIASGGLCQGITGLPSTETFYNFLNSGQTCVGSAFYPYWEVVIDRGYLECPCDVPGGNDGKPRE